MNATLNKPKGQEPQRWASLAEPQLCVMEALTAQLSRVNCLLEGSFNDLSSQFVEMAEDVKTLRTLTGASAGSEAETTAQRIEKTLAQSIMSMQFQDRVSQNLVITMNVLGALASELETALATGRSASPVDHEATLELYHFLRLGEIKEEFLASLTRRGFIRSPEELGISGAETPKAGDDDIELF